MSDKQTFTWHHDVRRFRDKNGRFVSEKRVISYVEKAAKNFSEVLFDRSKALAENFTFETFSEWARSTRSELIATHTAIAIIALGGKKASLRFNTENGQVWREVELGQAEQLRFFDRFVMGVMAGVVALSKIPSRASSYALAGYSTYQNAVRIRELLLTGNNEESRVLQSANSCQTCLAQAALGWQPIGTLRRISDSECNSRCRCKFIYRKNANV